MSNHSLRLHRPFDVLSPSGVLWKNTSSGVKHWDCEVKKEPSHGDYCFAG
jgi:hypothetical protein